MTTVSPTKPPEQPAPAQRLKERRPAPTETVLPVEPEPHWAPAIERATD